MPDEITLQVVLDHMHAMQATLRADIRGVEERLTRRMDGLDQRMDGLEQRIDRVERNLSAQIDAIDQRLDALEIESLPKRVAALERRAGRR